MARDKVAGLEDKFDGLRGDMDRLVKVVAAQQEMVLGLRREWHILAEAITETNRDQPPDVPGLLADRLTAVSS